MYLNIEFRNKTVYYTRYKLKNKPYYVLPYLPTSPTFELLFIIFLKINLNP